ncbi:MAG: hypothetical protein HGA19_03490 [Oscillochloris sp.]|nr:hypothetical protein [Oscillochloris sp.]
MSKPKQQTKYVAENRNPITLARPGTKSKEQASEPAALSADAEAPSPGTPPTRRPRIQLSRSLLQTITLGGLIIVLVLMLAVWLTGALRPSSAQVAAVPTAEAPLDSGKVDTAQGVLGGVAPSSQDAAPTSAIPMVGVAPAAPAVGAGFRDYYDTHGGLRTLGNPISDVLTVNGREIQWFERARVERWPEYAGARYEIQLGRLGIEYTSGRQFTPQQFFVSQPSLRFFVETSHSLGGAFLTFWEQNGGLDVFGLPISEEFDEVQPDGLAYRVQYFERARLELHTEAGGTPYEVQVGLLGSALYHSESRPGTIQPVATIVPLP